MTGLRGTTRGYWPLLALLVAGVACSSSPGASQPRPQRTVDTGQGRRVAQARQGRRARRPPRARPKPKQASKPAVSKAALAKADASLPRPRELPTVALIDFKTFPDDRKGGYGASGRQIVVKPGKPGVIAAALASAKEGDTILVHEGTYFEGPSDNDGALRIHQKGLVLRAMPGAQVRIVPQGDVTKRGILITASNVLVHGFDLVGFSALGIGIGKEGETIEGVILSDVSVVGPKTRDWVDGIVVWPTSRGTGKAVVDGLLLRNVRVENVSLGISCSKGPCESLWLENVKVKNRSGSGSGADAIAVEDGENIVLVNVEVSGATADGIDLKAGSVLVMNSHVHHVRRNGIKLWRGGDVINALVHDTGADASLVFEKGRYRVLNSVLAFHNYKRQKSYNFSAGYGINDPVRVELINSIIYKTSGGMYFSDRTKLTIRNCIFFDIQNRNLLRARAGGREIVIPLSRQADRALRRHGLGSGNLFVDPQFVDPATRDFRLRPKSPAVDRGLTVKELPGIDLAGRPRLRGPAPEIGPFELR